METKLLDLNAYGVEEMSSAEMRETDGGVLGALAAIGLVVLAAALDDWPGFKQGFAYGFNITFNN